MKPPALIAGLLLAVLAFPTWAQMPPALPAHGPSPLLHVRFIGPPGLRVTFYPTPRLARDFAAPVAVGLRPGYVTRVKLTGFPHQPHEAAALYPTLEVLGTLQLPPGMRASDFPVPIRLTTTDFERVLHGALVTKVFVLEHPDRAYPSASSADEPLEVEPIPGVDPLTHARALGRPLLVLRLGERQLTPEELSCQAIAGTVLLPGERSLPLPVVPPWVPWACWPIYDPVHGPRPPQEECFHDGGDAGSRAGLDNAGRLRGLDPEDTIAEYSDSHGVRHLAISNRVCVCSPRFVAVRGETDLVGWNLVVAVNSAEALRGHELMAARYGERVAQQEEQTLLLAGRQRPSGIENVVRAEVTGRLEGPGVVVSAQETGSVTGALEPPPPPEKPLVLCKSADRQAAQVGDIITFTLRYTNSGGQPITDVAVSDSLAGRLEYVPGSAQSDRDAIFTIAPNEAGSMVLRWQISGRLLPGQTGVVRFQARVR
jgi:uncharacterized repeat protein (TIGR01451 family)